MILIIGIAIIIFILYKRYYNIHEGFSASDIAFFKLDSNNYPRIPNDHEYYNNPPVSNSGILSIKTGGKYCNNNKVKTFTHRQYNLECNGMKDVINNFFEIDVNKIASESKDYTIKLLNNIDSEQDENISTDLTTIIKPYDNNIIVSPTERLSKELDKMITRHAEIKDEILISQRFLKENEINAEKYNKSNKQLENDVDAINYNTNKSMQETLSLKQMYDDNIKKIATLHRYAKYVLLILAFMTLIYLFRKDANRPELTNNI